MLKFFNCDLHVHTCLSPCAELDMHPMAIVRRAIEAGLDLIAICDHNSSANIPYVIKAAQATNLKILPGMEITTSEEVHLLAIFDSLSNLVLLQNLIDQHLTGENDENRFGVQAIVNEMGEVEGINNQFLIGATDLSLDILIGYIHRWDGLAIAAHIDRESFSVLSQLGFIDDRADFDALEITPFTGFEQARIKYSELRKFPFIVSSDAHFIKDIGNTCTRISLLEPTFSELKMALKKQNGRYVLEQTQV
ncbi:MAG: histidinol-phosphatase [Deltaproteobacteria bacterium HGW-Deltaproteobacteria-10]|nr:MAG: histidinol-phosphatase [Deltaproteobacteria bacterium HGW-Deltaproteobacteria-10]